MKKIKALSIILAAFIACSALTACSSNKSDDSSKTTTIAETTKATEEKTEAAEETEEAQEDSAVEETAAAEDMDYATGMSEIITSYEELLATMGTLINNFDNSEEWWSAYAEGYKASSDITDQVYNLGEYAPEEYVDSHANIVVAMAAYTDAFDAIGNAANTEDATEQQQYVDQAEQLISAADELWAAAVE